MPTFDVAVIGAGVFGAWSAHWLRRSRRKVLLLDQYGPASARASSGGESRIIRMGYGSDEIYTHMAQRSLELWLELFGRIPGGLPQGLQPQSQTDHNGTLPAPLAPGAEAPAYHGMPFQNGSFDSDGSATANPLFHCTGVLWLAAEGDEFTAASERTVAKLGGRAEHLDRAELQKRYPQIAFDNIAWGLLEPDSGVLMARRAVAAVVRNAIANGVEYRSERIEPPVGSGRLDEIRTATGERISAGQYVFACGPWLPKIFPDLLAERMVITRQEVLFFGTSPGEARFRPPAMPTWLHHAEQVYGMPDLENRGFKISFDSHGPAFDPDSGQRLVSAESVAKARGYLARRFPALADAPLLESRVCQYENTSNGDFLIDRHPELENVYLAGGGSGHGFKHGPAVGEYVAKLLGGALIPGSRFTVASKATTQRRNVY